MDIKSLKTKVTKTGTRESRIALAEAYLERGRIIQRQWRTRSAGREYVCALAAFGPEINSSDCPADLMPDWMAGIVPELDDTIAPEYVPIFMRGLIDRAKLWHALTPQAWWRIRDRYNNCTSVLAAKWNSLGLATSNAVINGYAREKVERLFELIDDELELAGVSRETVEV